MPRLPDPGRSADRSPTSAPARLRGIWAGLPSERRLAALACAGLFLSLFLPWYQVTVIARGVSTLHQLTTTFSGWGAFSFVEAAVLLVSVGVLILLFLRADGRAFHVPGGDGGVVTAAGGWTCVLLIWRMFDKQGTNGYAQYATTSGIEWGIFVALIIAGALAYAGTRIRLAHDPEPPLPGSDGYLGPAAAERPTRRRRGARDRDRGSRDRGSRDRGSRDRGRVVADRDRGDRSDRRRSAAPDWSTGEETGWTPAPSHDAGGSESETARSPDPSAEAPTRRVRPRTIAQPPDEPATEPLVQRLRPPGATGRPGPADGSNGSDEPLTIRLDDE